MFNVAKTLLSASSAFAVALMMAQSGNATPSTVIGTGGSTAPAALAAPVIVGTENPFTGFVGLFPPPFNDQGQVASDGESFFDPFGFGADTSDGIKFNSPAPSGGNWVADANMGAGWVKLPVTTTNPNTWVLPANLTGIGCGSENEATCEPAGVWDLPGSVWVSAALGTYEILQSTGGLSDTLIASNTAPGGFAQLTFQSDALPEPMSLAIFGSALAGLGLLRRRRKSA